MYRACNSSHTYKINFHELVQWNSNGERRLRRRGAPSPKMGYNNWNNINCKVIYFCAIILGPISLTEADSQNVASPVFQNHKTKEWTNLDNITFSFDCKQRSVGFYADIEYNCQIFHMCDEEGNRIPHLCANETSFNQEYRICDWDYNFNCTESPKWFYLNELTYATEPPEDEDY